MILNDRSGCGLHGQSYFLSFLTGHFLQANVLIGKSSPSYIYFLREREGARRGGGERKGEGRDMKGGRKREGDREKRVSLEKTFFSRAN